MRGHPLQQGCPLSGEVQGCQAMLKGALKEHASCEHKLDACVYIYNIYIIYRIYLYIYDIYHIYIY